MRSPAPRLAAILTVCVLALSFTGCGSNNTGKIVGVWRMESTTASPADLNQLKAGGITLAFEFKADGTYATMAVPLNDTPAAKLSADAANVTMSKRNTNRKYTLGMGNRVRLIDPGDKDGDGDIEVAITGDRMTMKEDGVTSQLTRVR